MVNLVEAFLNIQFQDSLGEAFGIRPEIQEDYPLAVMGRAPCSKAIGSGMKDCFVDGFQGVFDKTLPRPIVDGRNFECPPGSVLFGDWVLAEFVVLPVVSFQPQQFFQFQPFRMG